MGVADPERAFSGLDETVNELETVRLADAKALEHVHSARIPLQYSLLQYLPAEDARLKKEAVSYVSLARKLQLRSVGDLRLEEYRQKIGKKLGMRTADWPPATLPPDE
mgnify:CR=1 FL=1